MKTKHFFKIVLPILAAVTLTAFKCGGENAPEEKVVIPTTNFDFTSYGCGMTYANMQSDIVYVINSAEEFANFFSCETDPQIDFATKTLLIVHGGLSDEIFNISTELSKADNTYYLKVDITYGYFTRPAQWHIALLSDKIDTQNVMLNLNIIQL
jgi:hypothetical protein